MLDISSISAVVAAGGVLIGVIIAVLELRDIKKTRQTELLHGLYSLLFRSELTEAWEKFRDREVLGYTEYKKKYGLVEVNTVVGFYSELAILVYLKLIDINLVYLLFRHPIKIVWEKLRPISVELRKITPNIYWDIEYLYNELQKREQRLQQLQQ